MGEATVEIDWSKSHNGIMLSTFSRAYELMPEIKPILEEVIPLLQFPVDEYLVDAKVHMLMPNEWPCIPNWHRDFVPRNEEREQLPELISGEEMYLWISGPPLTEFKYKGVTLQVPPKQWLVFTQNDFHRGVMSEIFTWRCFLRVIPKKFVHPGTLNMGEVRRHSQVYLDANKYKW